MAPWTGVALGVSLLGLITFACLAPHRSDEPRAAPTALGPARGPIELLESSVAEAKSSSAMPSQTSVAAAPSPDQPNAGAPLPTPLLIPRFSAFGPAPLTPDPLLAAKVVDRLSGRSGKFGVAIKELTSGRGVLIDPDGEYEAASLFKLWVMYEVYKQREAGNVSFAEHLVFTERHVAYDLGTLDRPAGASIPLIEALERMITISDNSSAILLTDRVGASTINRDLRALGMLHTRLILDDLVTSPADILGFLEMLAQGEAVSPQASAEMIHLMARQRVNDRIPKLLPEGVVVAHKTGNLPGVVNDVGVVYGPDAAFIIAVLASNTTNEAEAAAATGDLAAAAYEHFRGTSATPAPSIPTLAPAPTNGPAFPTPAPIETPVPSMVAPTQPGTQGIPASNPPQPEFRPGLTAPGDGPVRPLTPAALQKTPSEPSRSPIPQSAQSTPTRVQDIASPRPATPISPL